jgi:hypothetical protein
MGLLNLDFREAFSIVKLKTTDLKMKKMRNRALTQPAMQFMLLPTIGSIL